MGTLPGSTSITPTPFDHQWYQRDLYCLYSWVSHLARFNELNWVLSYSWPFCMPVARAQEWTHFITFSFLLSNRHGFWGNRLNKQGLFCISFLRWNQIMKDFPALYLQIFPFTKAFAAWIHYSRHFLWLFRIRAGRHLIAKCAHFNLGRILSQFSPPVQP